jgi:antitoxin VapB
MGLEWHMLYICQLSGYSFSNEEFTTEESLGGHMRTVSIFKNGKNQAVRLPKDMEFEGVSELEIVKEGDSIILRPSKPSWLSLVDEEKAGDDFLKERIDVIADEGRF